MDVEEYTPDLPTEDWLRVRPVVVEIIREVADHLPYPLAAVTNAVAHHVDWCANVAGFPMAKESLFRRDVIAYAVDLMPTSSPSTRGRLRAILLRTGEQLGTMEALPPLTPLSASLPSAPYTPDEIEDLCGWAEFQSSAARQASARALIALGLGAGLPTRDLCSIRALDVGQGGEHVHVGGRNPRTVPVSPTWAPALDHVAQHASDSSATLFRPGTRWHPNIVTVFVERSSGLSTRPTTQRMRVTWIVGQLTRGTPMHLLLHAAGVKSMDALVRYEKFLPHI